MQHDGLWCAFEDLPMGSEADFIAAKCNIKRTDQDAFALESHRRAVAAAESGDFGDETVAVNVPDKKRGQIVVSRDEGPRADTTLEALAKLRPTFAADGTVTAGNASQISDGAAALVVASEAVARQHNSPIKARIVATATSGVAPKELFIAPVSAIEKVLAKAKLKVATSTCRAERSVRRAVSGLHVAAGIGLGEDERPRRGDCAGASDRRQRGGCW